MHNDFRLQKLRSKLPILLVLSVLILLLCLCKILRSPKETPFQKLCQEILCEELKDSTLNLHFLLANPEEAGIPKEEVRLTPYEPGSACRPDPKLLRHREALQGIPRDTMTEREQYLADLLTREFSYEEKLSQFPYYDNPLSPHSGQQSTILTLLSEYVFYDTEDIETYLSLLPLIPPYLDGLSTYMEEKVAAGLSPGSECLIETADACEAYFSATELMGESHFLQTTFSSRLKNLTAPNGTPLLTKEACQNYEKQHNRLLKEYLYPAYRTLASNLRKLAARGGETAGLSSFENGRDYFEILVQSETGCDASLEEIKKKLSEELASAMNNCLHLLTTCPGLTDPAMEANVANAFPLQTPEEMLQHLQLRMLRDFPAYSDDLSSRIHTRICEIAPSMRKHSAPAFYLLPPLDLFQDNVIYLNPDDEATSYRLYTTLAHEGYPGHLYQTVYHYEDLRTHEDPTLWGLSSAPGFQEGYALYVENLSYDYVTEIYNELELPQMASYITYQKENRNMQLYLSSLLEILIHGENADLDSIIRVLNNFGITNREAIANLYRYIAWEPCCYLKYTLGYLEIKDLAKEAQTAWQEHYSPLSFHRFLLDYGPADFGNLRKKLYKAY